MACGPEEGNHDSSPPTSQGEGIDAASEMLSGRLLILMWRQLVLIYCWYYFIEDVSPHIANQAQDPHLGKEWVQFHTPPPDTPPE